MKKLALLLGFAVGCNGCGVKGYHVGYEQLKTPHGSVWMHKKVSNNLFYLYRNMTRELPLCLHGTQFGSVVHVEEVRFPLITRSDSIGTSYIKESCGDGYLGMVHNHPGASKENCFPSATDIARFDNDERAILEMIVCDVDESTGGLGFRLGIKSERLVDETRPGNE